MQVAGHAVHVVVIGKVVKRQTPIDPFLSKLAVESIGDLKIVLIYMAGVETFVTFIIGYG